MDQSKLLQLNEFDLWVYHHVVEIVKNKPLPILDIITILIESNSSVENSDERALLKSLQNSIAMLIDESLLCGHNNLIVHPVMNQYQSCELNKDQRNRFEQFWEVFDYKKHKVNTMKAWLKIESLSVDVSGDFSEILLKKILDCAFYESKIRKNHPSPMYPQAWLNKKMWMKMGLPSDKV